MSIEYRIVKGTCPYCKTSGMLQEWSMSPDMDGSSGGGLECLHCKQEVKPEDLSGKAPKTEEHDA